MHASYQDALYTAQAALDAQARAQAESLKGMHPMDPAMMQTVAKLGRMLRAMRAINGAL